MSKPKVLASTVPPKESYGPFRSRTSAIAYQVYLRGRGIRTDFAETGFKAGGETTVRYYLIERKVNRHG